MAPPRRRRKHKRPVRPACDTARLEALEPRILLSTVTGAADVPPPPDVVETPPVALNLETAEPESASDAQAEERRLELVFVDTGVEDYESLVADLRATSSEGRSLEIFYLESNRDGVEQISEVLADFQRVDAVHIISHGSDAAVQLGNSWLSNDTLSIYENELTSWSTSLAEDADLLFYGCELADGGDGNSLIDQVAKLTGADVAASDDLTGAATLGGDWVLEYTVGEVETQTQLQAEQGAQWQGLLALSDGLVAHYAFDEGSGTTAVDSTSYGADGTHDGTPGPTHVAGVMAGALEFSGDSDGVEVADPVDGHLDFGTGDFSISFWFQQSGAPAGTERILGKLATGSDPGFVVYVDNAGYINFGVSDGSLFEAVWGSGFLDGNWHHVVAERNGGSLTLHVDGVDVDTWSGPTGSVSNGENLRFGSSSPVSGDYDGKLDEVRFYNRTLSDSEIAQLGTLPPANTAPTAVDDAYTTPMDTALVFDPTANDTDADGDPTSVISFTQPANGTVVDNGNGTFTYTPDSSYVGVDTFDYLITDAAADLQHSWALDGDALDAVGSADGTVNGASTVAGNFGDALAFDGTDDYVSISNVDYSGEFTIAFDFKLDDISGSLFQYLYSHGDIDAMNSVNVFISEASHDTHPAKLRTVIRDANDSLDNAALDVDILPLVGDGLWHTYSATVSSSGIEVFIDGVSVASDATRGTDGVHPTGPLYLGARQDLNADRFFGGSLDSVQIFGTALSTAEVSSLANGDNRGSVTVTVDPAAPSDLTVTATETGGLSLNEDGGSDAHLIADDGGAILGGATQFTYEVRFSYSDTSHNHELLSYMAADGDDSVRLSVFTNQNLLIEVANQTVQSSAFNYHSLADGEPHTLSVTWDASGGAWEVYVDGVSVDSGTGLAASQALAAGGTLVVGQDQDTVGGGYSSTEFLEGTLYDVRLFDDVRTAAEIATRYNSTVPHDESGLIANWQFDKLSGDGVITESVSGNNLTVAHAAGGGFTSSSPQLSLTVEENALNGTVVGTVSGTDAERDAQIAALLAADPDLYYDAHTAKFYKAVGSTTTWLTAQSAATGTTLGGVSGQLVTIRSAHENEVVNDIQLNSVIGGANTWLGAADIDVEGEWRWYEGATAGDHFWLGAVTGSSVDGTYSNWKSATAPNDNGLGEDAAYMLSDGTWEDNRDNVNFAYIIEWDAEAVLDGTQALTYSIQSQTVAGAFEIDGNSGTIRVADGTLLDYETDATHTVTIRTTDVDGNAYDEAFTISLRDLVEDNNAPTDLSSGIELNTDGGNDAYLVANDGGILLGGLSSLTYEIQFATSDTSSFTPLVSYATATNDNEFVFVFAGNDAYLYIADTDIHLTSIDYNTLRDGSVQHLAVTWENSSGSWAVYSNGELIESGTGIEIGNTIDPGGTLIIGNEQDALGGSFQSTQAFQGTLYDVRVWNEVRSHGEIAFNHQQKLDSGSLPSGLIANWQMDGFNGSSEVVDVVSGNNLSIGHAAGAGFTASTPVEDLHVSENAVDGTTVGFVVPSDPDSPQDIVGDGLFLSEGTSYQLLGAGSTIGPWTVQSGDVEVAGNTLESSLLGGNTIDLNGSTAGVIEQTLATEVGRQYQVVFALSGDWSGGDAVKDLRAAANGESQDFQISQPGDWSTTNLLWEHRSFTFTADSTATELTFASMDGANSYGPLIADVQVIEVPLAISTILNNDPTLSYDAATGKFYQVATTQANWSTALYVATTSTLNGISGQLVTIDSAYENEVVHDLAQTIGADIWLGAADQSTEGDWRWLSGAQENEAFWSGDSGGTAVSGQYVNWFVGEPSVDAGGGGDEDVARMLVASGQWADAEGIGVRPYIIEYDASQVLSNYAFSLTDDANGRFAIDGSTGAITVADASQLDYEAATSHDVTVEVTDAAGHSYSEVMSISVDNALEASQSLPGPQSVDENQILTFSSGNGNAVTVDDSVITANTEFQVNLSVDNGVLTLAQTTGLNFVEGSDGTGSFVVNGTESALNAALEGMTFTPDAGYNGAVTLNMTTALAADLQGHYTFTGGSAADQSAGTAQPAVLVGGADTTADVDRGEVLQLDAAGEYVRIDDLYGQPADVTLAAWVNFSSTAVNGGELISLGNDVAIRINDWSEGVSAFFYDGSTHQFIGSGTTMNAGEWHHVAFSFDDANDTQTLYIDGQVVATASYASSITWTGWFPQSTIGTHADVTDSSFDLLGMVDDARIYTQALSADEIAAIYAGDDVGSGTVAIAVNPVNDAPALDLDADDSAAAGVDFATSWTESNGPVAIVDADATLSDVDSSNLTSLAVTIANLLDGSAELLSADTTGTSILASYNPGTGTLLLSGSDSVANYQQVLRTVTYDSTSETPDETTRVITFVANDGSDDSPVATTSVTVMSDNDVNVITTTAGATTYTEQQAAVAIDSGLTLVDPDGAQGVDPSNLYTAVVQITGNYSADDTLGFTDTTTIVATDFGDRLVLSVRAGQTASVADFEAALRSVTFYNGSDAPSELIRTVSFTFDDGIDSGPTATKQIQLTAVNDAPVNTAPSTVSVLEDGTLAFTGGDSLQVGDVDALPTDTLRVQLNVGVGGLLSLGSTTGLSFSAGDGTSDANMVFTGTIAELNAALATLTFDTTADFTGNVNLMIATNDLGNSGIDPGVSGDASSEEDVDVLVIQVDPVNDAPVRTAGSVNNLVVAEDSGLTSLGLGALAYGAGGGSDESGQTLTYEVTVVPDPVYFGTIYLADDTTQVTTGTYSLAQIQGMQFQPAPNESGSFSFFSFRVTDSGGTANGGSDSLTETLRIDVTAENDAPLLGNNALVISEGATVVLSASNVSASDVETAAGLLEFTVSSVSGGRFEAVANPGVAITTFTQQQVLDGDIQFVHDGGEAAPSYAVTVSDGSLSDGPEAAAITFTNVNDAPTAAADAAAVLEGGTTTIDLAANDTDPDDGVDPTSIEIVGAPSNGSLVVNGDGTVDYTHDGSETTTDSFTYRIRDASGAVSNTATVSVSVTPQNDSPFIDLDADDSSGTPGSDFETTFFEGGGPVLISDGDVVISDSDHANLASMTVLITNLLDGASESLSADVTGTAISASYDSGTGLLTLSGSDTLANYQAVLETVTYHNASASPDLTDRVLQTVASDGGPIVSHLSNIATTTIRIVGLNDAPTAVDDAAAVNEGASVGIDLAANDTDPDNPLDLTSIQIVGAPANGSILVNGDGTVTYTHDGSETTTDTFTYTIQDLSGATSNVATVSITVNPVNDAPTAGADAAVVNEGQSVVIDVAGNDSDPDSALDLGSIVITTAPTNGTLIDNGDGTLTYTHDGSETVSDTFAYRIDDVSGSSSNIATVNLTINAVDDSPILDLDFDDSSEVGEDFSTTFTEGGGPVLVVDSDGFIGDVDSANLAWLTATITNLQDGSAEILSANTTGTSIVASYNAVSGILLLSGTDSLANYQQVLRTITYDNSSAAPNTTNRYIDFEVNDGTTTSNTAVTIVSVVAVNDAPTAVGDAAIVNEGSSVVIDVAGNDTDPDDGLDLSSITVTGAPANGSLVDNGDGTLTYTHDGSETTADSFTYTIRDLSGAVSNAATVNITVNPQNDAPTAVNDAAVVDEGAAVGIDLAANDTDPDNPLDLTSIQIVGAPANGSILVNGDGTVTYTHDGSETIADSFTYTIRDLSGAVSNTATVTITVTPQNDAPTAVNDAAVVDEGAAVGIDLAANDTDPDNPLDLTSIQIVGAPANGSILVNGDGTVTYTHDGSETTGDSFTYTIRDLSGAVSNTATVNVTVNPQNDAPTAVDDAALVDEGAAVNIDLATNDTDPDNPLDLTSVQIVGAPANGSIVVNGDGTVTYTHDGSETIADSFTYTIRDLSGAVSNTATVTITVTPQNDAPTAVNDAAVVDEGAAVGIDLAANDTDPDNPLDLTSIQIVGAPANGSILVNGDGTVTYTHDGSETTGDSFTYTIRDLSGAISNTATVNVTVTPQNDAPTAVDDAALVNEGAAVNIDLAANDTDPDNPLDLTSIQIVGAPTNGSILVNGDGTVTYTHDGSETTGDSFTYTIRDLSGAVSNTATVNVTVNPQNDAPTAVDDAALVDEGAAVNIDLATNDTDPDNPLDLTSVQIVGAPANGSILVNGDGTVTYTHDGSETTADSFTYTIRDLSGAVSNTATVNVTVTPQNDAPTAVDDAAVVNEGAPVNIDLVANDTDPDNALDLASIQIVGAPANGTVLVNGDGTVTYTHDGSETTADSFTYTIRDLSGAISNTTVNVAVTPQNDPPTAVDDAAVVNEGAAVGIDLAANDTDPDNPLDLTSIQILGSPANGSIVVNGDGTVTYTHDGSETTGDSFTYTIRDLSGSISNTATVNVTVTPQNDAPTAVDDAALVNEGAAVNIDLAANDTDPDNPLDLASIQIIGAPANGTVLVNGDGTVTYTHDGSETIADSFTYTIRDLSGAPSNTTTVNVTVNPQNDAPVLYADTFGVGEGAGPGSWVGQVVAVDPDPGDSVVYAIVGGNVDGAFAIDPSTGDVFVANPNALGNSGRTAFDLMISAEDSAGAIDSRAVRVEIEAKQVVATPEPEEVASAEPSPDEPKVETKVATPQKEERISTADAHLTLGQVNEVVREKRELHAAASDSGRFETRGLTLVEAERTSGGTSQVFEEEHDKAAKRYVHPAFLESIETLRSELTRQLEEEGADIEWVHRSFQSLAIAGATGLLSVIMRSSSLAAIGFSAVPLWKRADPLTVLSLNEDQRRELEASLKSAEDKERQLDSVLGSDPEADA